jgi:hypothetical protein
MTEPLPPAELGITPVDGANATSTPPATTFALAAPDDAVWPTFAAVLAALLVAALLTSARLVAAADHMTYGPPRDALMAVATSIHAMARAGQLDQPAYWVDRVLGRTDDDMAQAGVAPSPLSAGSAADPARGAAHPAALAPAATERRTAHAGPATPWVPETPTDTAESGAPLPTDDPYGPTPLPPAADYPTADTAGGAPGLQAAPPRPTLQPHPAAPTDAPRGMMSWPTAGSPRLRPFLPPAERPPEPPAAPPRAITTAQALKVHVAGDSAAEPLGYELERYAERDKLIAADLDFKLGSGLDRPDFFDWPGRLAETMAGAAPEVVVFDIGGNDTKDVYADGRLLHRSSPEWRAEYRKRAASVMDIARGDGVRLYWVGMPVLRDPDDSRAAAVLNGAVQEAALTRPWVRYVDIWPRFAGLDGGYATYLPDPTGEQTRVRQDDGVHLTRTGTNWVAAQVYQALQQDWAFAPASAAAP